MTVCCVVSILKAQGEMPNVYFLLLQLQNLTTFAQ